MNLIFTEETLATLDLPLKCFPKQSLSGKKIASLFLKNIFKNFFKAGSDLRRIQLYCCYYRTIDFIQVSLIE